VIAHVSANVVKAASASPDVVNRGSPRLKLIRNLVALMKEPLASNLLIADLRAVLIEELPVSDLRHLVDPLRAGRHKEDLLQTKTLAIKRLSGSLTRTRTASLTKKKEMKQKNTLCHGIETIKSKELI
jgi:hypothetical protein|tara:strand:- start:557 stop:940 length:384 start_codon:yes stop_codon:yes gene_type:complete